MKIVIDLSGIMPPHSRYRMAVIEFSSFSAGWVISRCGQAQLWALAG